MEPSNTPINDPAATQNTPTRVARLSQDMLFKKRPVIVIMLVLIATVVGLVWFMSNGINKTNMQRAADNVMNALTSSKESAVDSLEMADNPLIKHFYQGAQTQMRGSYRLAETTEADGAQVYNYTLDGASAAKARIIVSNDAKVTSVLFGSDELTQRTTKFTKDEVSGELLESRKAAGYQCLEQQDYSLTNDDTNEQDFITWSKIYEPTSTNGNKMMTVFFENGTATPSQSIDFYRNWSRFAIDMHQKQWMFRIRPVVLNDAIGSVRENFDYAIAQERAQVIRTKLIEAGVMEDRIIVDEPFVSTTTFDDENEPNTRRVDLVIDPTCLQ